MFKGFLGLGFANYKGADVDQNLNVESSRKTDFSWQLGVAMDIAVLEGRLGYHSNRDRLVWLDAGNERVNGQVLLRDNEPTGAYPGRLLRV